MNITIDHLNMTYPTGKQALRDINLTLTSPSLIGLLGPNGAGKSTLMKLLVAGLLPTSGTISVDGTVLTQCERQLKASLGYLPQHFGLYDELTVWQFLDYIAALKGIKRSKEAIEQVIAATDLTEKRKAKIRTLSGGQRQRVGIAQALLGAPQFLIFDEPTVGLDPEERIRFRNLFSEAAQDKLVLLSTHIIEDVQSVCNQLIVIDQGKILFNLSDPDKGPASAEILAHEIIHQWWGLGATLLDAEDGDWSDEGITVYTTYRLMRQIKGADYAQQNYVEKWERTMEELSASFYRRHPEYADRLPERYQNDILANESGANQYDGNALMIDHAAQIIGEEKMDEVWARLFAEGGAEIPPYISLNDFLTACGLEKGAVGRE